MWIPQTTGFTFFETNFFTQRYFLRSSAMFARYFSRLALTGLEFYKECIFFGKLVATLLGSLIFFFLWLTWIPHIFKGRVHAQILKSISNQYCNYNILHFLLKLHKNFSTSLFKVTNFIWIFCLSKKVNLFF